MRWLAAAAFAVGLMLVGAAPAQITGSVTPGSQVGGGSVTVGSGLGFSPGGASMYEESLEWMAADSKLIVRGTIENVTADSVSFKINDVIKGQSEVTILTVARPLDVTAPKAGDDALLFLKENTGKTSDRYPLSLRWRQGCIVLDGRMTVCLMDFSGLTDRDQIIAAAREASAYPADSTRKPLVLACKTPVGHKCLIQPIDERLETVAQRLLASYSMDDRVLGAKAIVPFQSDANAALLQPLLSDTRSRTPRGAGKWQLG